METEAHTDIPTEPSRRRDRRVLLSALLLLLLIGSAEFVFAFVRQLDQNAFHLANPVPDLSTNVHWQQVLQNHLFPTLVAAPGEPATLYMCDDLDLSSGAGFTFARSTDAGVHWETLTSGLPGNGNCEIAVNPLDASDLYIALSNVDYENNDASTTLILKHSRDGGQTWTDIAATLALSPFQRVAWAGSDLVFAGQRLFARQEQNNVFHLITSSDGGQTWTIVDTQLLKPHRELQSYAVDPAAPNTIYALIGPIVRFKMIFSSNPLPLSTSTPTPSPIPTPTPAPIAPGQLYKSTNMGASWQELLTAVPFGSEVQLASANAHLLYIGGLPLDGLSAFQMQVSRNSGASWQTVLTPGNTQLRNRWFVDASGLLYGAVEEQKASSSVPIQRYNPSTRQWSILTVPARDSLLQAITPAASGPGDILWASDFRGDLYRGTT